MTDTSYPRDLRGYGRNPPDPRWPDGARVAVQFVVNFEEGGENNILHGDPASEAFLSDVLGRSHGPDSAMPTSNPCSNTARAPASGGCGGCSPNERSASTVFGVATALARNPEIVAAMREASWDIACHGLKWIEHKNMSRDEERASIAEAIRVHTQATGERPVGWYTGRSSINTNSWSRKPADFFYPVGFLRRRPAVLAQGTGSAAGHHPLYPRQQRHAFHQPAGLQHRRGLLHVSQGWLRRLVCRG